MIQLDAVSKQYRGRLGGLLGSGVRALEDVSLRVDPGTALGIIGLNGAGKSTLLRLLLGYVHPTRGEVRIDGLPPRAYAEQRGVGYVPERVSVPTQWTVCEALRAYALLGNLHEVELRVGAVLRRLGLEELAERGVGQLSKGNLQRLAIAQALLGERKLLVLDEPTDGLDPVWIAELREIIAEWRQADPSRVVVLASHNLPEVERTVDRVLVLHQGRVHAELGLAELQRPGLEKKFLDLIDTRQETAA